MMKEFKVIQSFLLERKIFEIGGILKLEFPLSKFYRKILEEKSIEEIPEIISKKKNTEEKKETIIDDICKQ